MSEKKAEIALEPEQMTLWRNLIAYRDRLVENYEGWRRFRAEQRAGWERMHDETDAEGDGLLRESEGGIDATLARLAAEIGRIDDEIASHSPATQKDRKRGLSLKRLRDLVPDHDRAELEHWILHYLQEAKARNPIVEMTARTVAALAGRPDLDLAAVTEKARRQLEQEGSARTHVDIARRISQMLAI
ncbi:MAG TPA: hypothetical protein VHE30_01445 [Polyangiaceae bacterium]|nr:hypothetical protein [Polyangiaceae bacterium]